MPLGKIYPAYTPRMRTARRPRKPSAMKIAKKAYALSKQNIEEVNTVTTQGATALDPNGTVAFMNVPTTSTGDKMHYISIDYNMLLFADPTATNTTNYRVSVVLDRMPRGALPAFGDIYNFTGFTCLQEFENNERFKIIKSYYGTFYDNVKTAQFISGRIKTNLVIEGEAGYGIGDIRKNAYFLVYWTDAGTTPPTIEYNINVLVNE